MNIPQSVFIHEIGPRINFQYGSRLSIEQKLQWISRLIDSGLNHIEVTTLMHSANKQQFNEATELALKLKRENNLKYGVLIPNKRSLTRAFVVDADEINFFIASNETVNLNVNKCSIKQSLNDIKKMTSVTKDYEKKTRVYLSTTFSSPYESVSHQKAIELASQLVDDGVDEVAFVDSGGMATPYKVKLFLEDLLVKIPKERCSMQFYNTTGCAISNIFTTLSYGVQRFVTANGGFGGCIPSEDLISFLHKLEIGTGVNELKLLAATNYISAQQIEEVSSNLLQTKKHL
ncbi:hypothetical protein [Bacillus sp. AFS017336]|uniref:hypothetical protein n=1 Tax=Bacillus sp. AFS017336 TaxID=2033489 RepID=UPI0015CF7012|nr:hypothetical protein [Bacillus sp. AFS017336]